MGRCVPADAAKLFLIGFDIILTSIHLYFFTFFLGRKIAYFGHLEGYFDPRECLESLRGVLEIDFELIDAPNGLTATRFSKKKYLFVFSAYESRWAPSLRPQFRLSNAGIADLANGS